MQQVRVSRHGSAYQREVSKGRIDVPGRPTRLVACAEQGVTLPESTVIDLRSLGDMSLDDAAEIVAVALEDIGQLLSIPTATDACIAVRSTEDESTCPAIVNLSLNGNAGHSGVLRAVTLWLADGRHKKGGPSSFLVQRMRPSPGDPESFVGLVQSRQWNGEPGTPGFVTSGDVLSSLATRTVSYASWAGANQRHAVLIDEWLRQSEMLVPGACELNFGISEGQAYLLDLRTARAPGSSRSTVLVELVNAGRIERHAALMAVEPRDVELGVREISNLQQLKQIAVGVPGGPRAACGRAVLDGAGMEGFGNDPLVLIRETLGPLDAPLISRSAAVVVNRAGDSSHMVVLARGLGKATVTAVGLSIHPGTLSATCGQHIISQGEWLSVDEHRGMVYAGRSAASDVAQAGPQTLIEWATTPAIPVLVNAEQPTQLSAGGMRLDGIGLCRSERHLPAEVSEWIRTSEGVPDLARLPVTVGVSLTDRLESLLRASRGCVVHYRLLDIGDFVGLESGGGYLRGIRWGSESGFYQQQLRWALEAISRVSSDGVAVNVVFLAPFVSVVEEVRWLRRQLERAARERNCGHAQVRVGAMVETPVGVQNAASIAAEADTVCVGSNDLTQQMWAVSRDDVERLLAQYESLGRKQQNPFVSIDASGLGPSIRAIADAVARYGRKGARVVVCGEHASVPENAELWAELGEPTLSVQPTALGVIRVALYQEVHRRDGDRRWPLPTARVSATRAFEDVKSAVRRKHYQAARSVAWEWAAGIARSMGNEVPTNWKFFKRDLAGQWFGRNQSRRFRSGWNSTEIVAYAETLRAERGGVRFSVFPETIAIHSLSEVLPGEASTDDWKRRIDRLDRSASIEVFAQQHPSKLCFRTVLTDGVVRVEAGFGQAMYVFEQERGEHIVVAGQLFPTIAVGSENTRGRLTETVGQFVDKYADGVSSTMLAIQTALGVDWVAIEGYYAADEPLVVCDLDLPLDLAFHAPASA